MQSLRDRMDKVASANVPVLIQGESGTGKDIIARMIHGLSPWRTGPFVKVNCPAIPGTLLESELFGYEKGAFTGAYGSKPGRVELAHRGTLFLDEISELDLGLQSKLLQLLQDGQFCRIGAQEDKKVEVRVVCATNRVLEAEIESGTFRQDLFYRINVVNLQMPPLRERKGDIPDLVTYFLEYYNRKYNCRARTLSGDLMSSLQKHHWPGNIRELENLIKRYVILGNEEVISSDLVAHQQEYSHPRHQFRWADRAEDHYPPGHPGTGAQSHPESSAGPPLESQAGGPRSEHQLPRAAVQDSRCRPAAQPLFPPPGRTASRPGRRRRLKQTVVCRVGRAPSPAAFDFDFDLFLISNPSVASNSKSKIKGGGQECPPPPRGAIVSLAVISDLPSSILRGECER